MNRINIVLADDHAVVRAGLRNALDALPNVHIVGEVANGSDLLPMLSQLQPDCLLIDVTMPHFEPIIMTRQIRQLYPEMKILVVSAHDDDMYVQGLFGAGVNGYHLKDQSLHDLQVAVQRVMAGERWMSHRLLDKLLNPAKSRHAIPTPTLTTRQLDILRLLMDGRDNLSIARELGISIKTVENHLTRLYRQLNVQSRLEAVNVVSQRPEILSPHQPHLPTKSPRQASSSPPRSEHQKSTRPVLVVDDNARFRRRLTRVISKFVTATIGEAENIAQAVAWGEENRPHLVFVDVVLGNEDGIDCVRQLKARLPQTRLVLISAYPDREFHRRGIEAGAVALLDKKDLDGMALQQIIADSL